MHDKTALDFVRQLVVNMRKDAYDLYIGRNGSGVSACFGNPFPIVAGNPNATREAVCSKAETLLLEGTTWQAVEMRAKLHLLKGKKLGCFCSPNLCHGHALAHHANSLEPGEVLPLGGKIARLTQRWVDVVPPVNPIPLHSFATDFFVGFSRYPLPGKAHLEMSSHGDKRFSALYARLKDGRSIEEAYQLDVKGYRAQGNDWRLGKGKPPLKAIDLWKSYKALWSTWLDENPSALADLSLKARNCILTDKFANGPISQARALAELLSERLDWQLGAAPKSAAPKAVPADPSSSTSAPASKAVKESTPAHQGDLFGDVVEHDPVRTRMRP